MAPTTKTTKTTRGEGNTITSPLHCGKGDTSMITDYSEEFSEKLQKLHNSKNTGCRKWVFTLNNWTDDEYSRLMAYCKKGKIYYIVGKEVGDSGTPHLQGFIQAKGKGAIKFKTLKNQMPRAHLAKARGGLEDNRKYCSKDGDFECNIPLSRQEKINRELTKMVLRPWQQHVADLIADEIAEARDHRTIHWFWEADGNTGKSYLNWYLNAKYKPIVASGKAADIFNQIKCWFDDAEHGAEPELCIVDVPRTFGVEYVSYLALEKVKDRLLYSGKYEGGRLQWVRPTCVIVFANEEPVRSKMSSDRWNVVNVSDIGIPITPDSGYSEDEETEGEGWEYSPI